jgi:hypothetical protein
MIGKDLKNLFDKTKEVVYKHEKESKDRGEDFNIFSVLGMESNETKTHSGMLVALLDPKGNHYQETAFLKLFLEEIGYDYSNENLSQVKVKAEHHLGKISKDFLKGGFIDILITFPSGKAIAIENKIYAGDQRNQMYRYSRYQPSMSSLYYLNLFGNQPSKISLNGLSHEDYSVITYRNQIMNWLEKCMNINAMSPILRTSLKQYYILIKQLTHSMEKPLKIELNKIIFENLEEAKYIHSHYQKAVDELREKFRIAVFEKLSLSLNGTFKVEKGKNSSYMYSQIWIYGHRNGGRLKFGIESFSGKGNNHGRLFVGIIDRGIEGPHLDGSDNKLSKLWPIVRNIKTAEGNPFNLSSTNILEKLNNDSLYFTIMVDLLVKQVVDFVNTYQNHFNNQTISNA